MNTAWFSVARLLLVSAGLLALACGCAGRKPEPLRPPLVGLELSHFYGSPLSGPTAAPRQVEVGDDMLPVTISMTALRTMATDRLRPLGAQAGLIIATRGGQPVLPSGKLTLAARTAAGEEAVRFEEELARTQPAQAALLVVEQTALPPGVTASLEATDLQSPYRRLRVDICRPSTGKELLVALVIEDLVEPNSPLAAADEDEKPSSRNPARDQAAVQRVPQRETALLDGLPIEQDGLIVAIVAPARFSSPSGEAVAVLVRVGPEGVAPPVEMVARVREDLRRSASEVASRPDTLPLGREQLPGLRTALLALADPQQRRQAVVFLAEQTGATMCQDVALVADDESLQTLAAAISERTAVPPVSSVAALGWALDSACISTLASLQSGNALPPELSSVLVLHAGEVGRRSDSLEEVLRGLDSRAGLDARLVAENTLFLEDTSPASRVRAFDWLRARNQAPEGYDPLGDARARRTALDRIVAGDASEEFSNE
jgi:hypothetical protein